jgi:hypothetical protein
MKVLIEERIDCCIVVDLPRNFFGIPNRLIACCFTTIYTKALVYKEAESHERRSGEKRWSVLGSLFDVSDKEVSSF